MSASHPPAIKQKNVHNTGSHLVPLYREDPQSTILIPQIMLLREQIRATYLCICSLIIILYMWFLENNVFSGFLHDPFICHVLGVMRLYCKTICRYTVEQCDWRTWVSEKWKTFDIYFCNDNTKLLVIYASCIAMETEHFVNKSACYFGNVMTITICLVVISTLC